MSTIDTSKLNGVLKKRGLPVMEWLAENAYIPPGMHRFLTAAGLMGGLWSGRQIMDVVTARDAKTGDPIALKDAPEPLKPLYNRMPYNAYSDDPRDRWRGVANAFVPAAMGGAGAYLGRTLFFHGNTPGGKKLHQESHNLRLQYQDRVKALQALRNPGTPIEREVQQHYHRRLDQLRGILEKEPERASARKLLQQLQTPSRLDEDFANALTSGKTLGNAERHLGKNALRKRYIEKLRAAEITGDLADGILAKLQGDAMGRQVISGYQLGASSGGSLFGAWFSPMTNNGAVANAFARGAGKLPNFAYLPGFIGRPLNKMFGNYSAGSRYLPAAITDLVKMGEANTLRHGGAENWLSQDKLKACAKDVLQIIHDHSDEEVNATAEEIQAIFKKGVAQKEALLRKHPDNEAKISEELLGWYQKQFSRSGYLDLLDRVDARLGKPLGHLASRERWGDGGIITRLSRMTGSYAKEKPVAEHVLDSMKLRYGQGFKMAEGAGLAPSLRSQLTFGGISLVSSVLLASLVYNKYNDYYRHIADEARGAEDPEEKLRAPRLTENAHAHLEQHKKTGPFNGIVLDGAQWLSRVLIVPPSMHRFMNAAYLSAFLYGGLKVANALAGRNMSLLRQDSFKSLLPKESLPFFLKPLHGKLAYTPGDVKNVTDRARQAAHYLIPVGFGMVGTYTGSHMYFRDRISQLKKAEYLEDYTDAISFQQSNAFGRATAVTSIFNTGSGVHLLPFLNFSSNLNNRFLMGSGQQVAFPLFGKWWSGNPGAMPWGVKLTLKYLVNYLANNPAEHPREISNLVHVTLAKLYPDLPKQELLLRQDMLVEKIYSVRDTYLENGVIPEKNREPLKKAMSEMLTKGGLERTLVEIGLNPLEAKLSHNGMSGRIANTLGEGRHVRRLENEYREKAVKRLEPLLKEKLAPQAPPVPGEPGVPVASIAEKAYQGRIGQHRAAPAL